MSKSYNFIKKSEWDSSFFNFNIAEIKVNYLDKYVIDELNDFIIDENITLTMGLLNSDDSESVILAESNNFHFADIRMTLEKKLFQLEEINLNKSFQVNLAEKKHIPDIQKMSTFFYKQSRYFFDRNFQSKKIVEFYKGWIEKAVLGLFDDECICIFDKKSPVGFCTIKYLSSNSATIGLFGISKKYQKMGLSNYLLKNVNNILFEKGIKSLSVVTQGRNIAALKSYQRAGFVSELTQLWYHKWIN